MVERLDPGFAGYLMTNRAFVAPSVAEAVASLGLRAGSSVLDAGTGAGHYVMDEPGFFVMHPTILATGARPPTEPPPAG
jgi:hypothetical protein